MLKSKLSVLLVLCLLVINVIVPVPSHATQYNPATDWFKDAKYGVFVDYLYGNTDLTGDWNTVVNAFNCTTFANQIEQTGAKYVIFTLGQNSGYYCAPNATYDTYTGYTAGQRCSNRDLINDLYDALNPKGIKLMLYFTGGAPSSDLQACTNLGWVDYNSAPQAFQTKWEDIIRTWSIRYGTKIAGWWFDGCYPTQDYAMTYAHNWSTFAAAAKAGNPDSIVAFNNGLQINKNTDYQDYTAGEYNSFSLYPTSRWYDGIQWQICSFLGTWWGYTDCRYSDGYMKEYIKRCNDYNGVVTMDIAIYKNGSLSTAQLNQLTAIKGYIRDGTGNASNASAAFLTTDTTTQGNWQPVYGGDGYFIPMYSDRTPYYAQISMSNATNFVWADPTSDIRALQKLGSPDRIAAGTYSNSGTQIYDIQMQDNRTHKVALYCLDWDNQGRAQTVVIRDAVTNAVLDTRSVSSYNNGKYLVWNLKGHVKIEVTHTAGNGIVNGLFFSTSTSEALKLKLMADAGITKDGSNYISKWADQSGHGFDAVQNTGANKPLWVANVVNGKPVVRFDGINDMIKNTLAGEMNTFTLTFVMRPAALRDYNQVMFQSVGWGVFEFHSTANGGVYIGTNVNSRIEPADGAGSGTLAAGSWAKYTYVFHNGYAKFYKNGVLKATKSLATTNTWHTGFTLGQGDSATIDGDIAELQMYDSALSDTDRQAVEAALQTKYGF